jgi:hypothetical protein
MQEIKIEKKLCTHANLDDVGEFPAYGFYFRKMTG